MNVQLLLLLALVGPFCTFTRANPTPLPTQLDAGITETAAAEVVPNPTEGPKEELSVFTNPPPTEAAAAAEEVVPTELVPSAAPPDPVNTDKPVAETEAPAEVVTVAPAEPEPEPEPEPEAHITEAPAVETAAPTDTAVIEDQPVATADAKIEGEDSAGQDVVVEDGIDEGLTSGQVVGIVIGSLLAVIIVIAVVIAAVRRMGKYSSAKNKKPAKKDSILVSPLRKKSAKQQERPKFWKF